MKKKYLIALDMDGTLLNSEKKMSPDTAAYLKSLKEEGYIIVICSGRPARAILPYYKELNLDTPIVCYNGSYIVNPSTNEISQKEMIPAQTIQDVITEIGIENFDNILCENDTDCYMLKHNEALFGFFWKDGMNVHFGYEPFKTMTDQYIMIIQMLNNELDDKLVKLCFSYPGLGIRFWDNGLCSELYYLDTNKGTALQKVAALYNIPKSNIICFGDASNDVQMFESSGIPVVMKNATEDMLALPNVRKSLDDNDHDGIKKTLEYLLATNR